MNLVSNISKTNFGTPTSSRNGVTLETKGRAAAYGPVRARLNDRLLWLVSFMVFAAPFFYGSNRPILWVLWAMFTSVAGLWWFSSMALSDARPRINLRKTKWILASFLILAIYMMVQILPLGFLVPAFHSIADPQTPILSNTLSLTPDDTALALMRWLSYGLVFYFVMQICGNPSRTQRLTRSLFWIIVIHAALGIVFLYQLGDTTLGIEKLTYKGSATAGFVNRNSYATFLAFGSILGIIIILQTSAGSANSPERGKSFFEVYFDRTGILPVALGWLVIMLALVATNSRMGVFAACCGMFFVLGIAIIKMPAKTQIRSIWLALTIIPLAIGVGVMLYGKTFLERVGRLETSDDLDVRLTLYRQTLQMIESRSVLGYGGQSFEFAFPLFHDPSFAPDFLWDKAHSTYLALWAEYGVIFGSLPILIVVYIFFGMLLSFFRRERPDYATLAGLGAIIIAAIHSLVDFSLEIQAVNFAFVAIIAAGYARTLESISSEPRI
jgi:hypothetical protein